VWILITICTSVMYLSGAWLIGTCSTATSFALCLFVGSVQCLIVVNILFFKICGKNENQVDKGATLQYNRVEDDTNTNTREN